MPFLVSCRGAIKNMKYRIAYVKKSRLSLFSSKSNLLKGKKKKRHIKIVGGAHMSECVARRQGQYVKVSGIKPSLFLWY